MSPSRKTSVLFVINPISGDLDKQAIEVCIRENYSHAELHFFKTSGIADAEKLSDKVLSLNQPMLVAVGGDGTLKLVAEVALKMNLCVSLFPAGSANGMAKELGIEPISKSALQTVEEQTKQLIEALENSSESHIDIVRINGELMLHLADFGLNAKLIRDFEKGDERGFTGYAKYAMQQLNDLNQFSATINTQNEQVAISSYMLTIANAKRYGTGAIINPNGSINDGVVDFVFLKDLDFNTMLTSLKSIITNDANYHKEQVEFVHAKQATIKLNKAVAFQIDGEYIGQHNQATVTCYPSALRIKIPIQ